MMFKRELAVAIVKGEKTATRRLPVSGKPRAMWRIERPWRYPVGKVFSVNPGRGVGAVAECEVTRRYMQPLNCMQDADAKKEGFRTGGGETARAAFLEAFEKINGKPDLALAIHVVEFKLAGAPCGDCEGEGDGEDWNGEEGSGPWSCGFCFGTGIEVRPDALELIRQLERDAAAA